MTPAGKELIEAAELEAAFLRQIGYIAGANILHAAVEAVKAEQSKHDAGDERLMLDILYGDDTEAN